MDQSQILKLFIQYFISISVRRKTEKNSIIAVMQTIHKVFEKHAKITLQLNRDAVLEIFKECGFQIMYKEIPTISRQKVHNKLGITGLHYPAHVNVKMTDIRDLKQTTIKFNPVNLNTDTAIGIQRLKKELDAFFNEHQVL